MRNERICLFREAFSLILVLAAALGTAAAEERRHVFDVPDGAEAAFLVEFPVSHPGRVEARAEWDGPRILSFRLEGPERTTARVRRTGPSPQRLEIDSDRDKRPWEGVWALRIKALPARGASSGTLTIVVPDPPDLAKSEPPRESDAPEVAPTPPAWAVPRVAPPELVGSARRAFEAVESFRAGVAERDGAGLPDPCGWQSDALEYLGRRQDALTSDDPVPEISTRRYFMNVVRAVRDVEVFRVSEDPILSGPPPEDRSMRRAWKALHEQAIRPLESRLDTLTSTIRSGHAPRLETEPWPPRLVACIAATERHFAAKAVDGSGATLNRQLAAVEWDRILDLAAALEAIAGLDASPTAASGTGGTNPVGREP